MLRARYLTGLLHSIALLASSIGSTFAAPGSGNADVVSRSTWQAQTEECAFFSPINKHRMVARRPGREAVREVEFGRWVRVSAATIGSYSHTHDAEGSFRGVIPA